MITLVLEHDNEWLQVTGDGDTLTLLSLPPSIGFLAVISGSVLEYHPFPFCAICQHLLVEFSGRAFCQSCESEAGN